MPSDPCIPGTVPRWCHTGKVCRFLRRGKALVLPCQDEQGQWDFLPVVQSFSRFGRLGKVQVLRYHPFAGSSNPAGLVLLRGNWDVQCMDRVFVTPTSLESGALLKGGMPNVHAFDDSQGSCGHSPDEDEMYDHAWPSDLEHVIDSSDIGQFHLSLIHI